MKCSICDILLKGKQTKFCSQKCKNRDGNNRHNSYLCQQKRGLDRKKELIKAKGGKCSICGYNKNSAALQFHHLEAHLKENQLDLRKLSNSTWEWCLKEASKCQLLCANCHAEEHHPDHIL